MNEVIQTILTRVSVRDFNDKTLTKEEMEALVQVGLYAPSARGQQTWHFTAILNQSRIAQLAAAIGKVLGNPDYCFYGATALIIPSNDVENTFGKEDNACALENIFVAAGSMGIGSVWINQLSGIANHPDIRPILTELGIPENHTVFGLAALGYATTPFEGMKEKIGTFTMIE